MVTSSLASMRKNEERIGAFIRDLPVNRLARQVYSPPEEKLTTIERYIQDRFLLHWREHLQTIKTGESVQPPEADNS